ncbi:hypothetical protein L2E82_02925 [Cichorium intybus]|uniref:Uncharacterized protein n=1 Tax=Cichorium intybus TaxID=13427 RepID=A0ACB9H464_CICIN|nr:hypothetical protein L2E82_02925 [Cichorium intybus]
MNGNGNMVFFEGSNLTFNLEDLFRASTWRICTTYKAALEDSNAVVVKRLKGVTVTKREFEQQMEIVGSIQQMEIVSVAIALIPLREVVEMLDYGMRQLWNFFSSEQQRNFPRRIVCRIESNYLPVHKRSSKRPTDI